MDRKDLQKYVAFGLVLLVCCLYVYFGLEKITSFDVWWHLASGRWMFQHHAIITRDPFSFTHYGERWYNTAWLFQWFIYLIYTHFGFAGLVIFKSGIVFLFFLVLCWIARVKGGNWWLFTLLALIVLFVAKGRFYLRPHIISYVYIALSFLFLELYRQKGRIHWVVPLVPLELLWVNIHGSFILLPLIIGAYAVFPILKGERKVVGQLAALVALVVLASFVNPFGPWIYKVPLRHQMMKETTYLINEWKRFSPVSLLNFGVNPVLNVGFFLFLLGVLLSFRLEAFLLLLFGAYLMFSHVRFIPLFFLFSYPFAFDGLRRLGAKRIAKYVFIPLLLLVLVGFYSPVKRLNVGFSYDRNHYPDALCTFIKHTGIRGNVFNIYGYGGFIIWNNWPDIKVFIDGRTPTLHTGRDFFLFDRSLKNPKTFWRLVWQYEINSVLIKKKHPLAKYLMEDPFWVLVCFDRENVLFVRKEPFESIVKSHGVTDIPLDFDVRELAMDKLKGLVAKLQSYDRMYPYSSYYKSLLGIVYSRLGDKRKALKAFQDALFAEQNDPDIYYDIGLMYLGLKDPQKAVEYLKRAVELNGKETIYWYKLGDAYYDIGNLEDAFKCYDKYRGLALGDVDTELFYKMGLVAFKLKRFEKAVYYFRLAIYTSKNLAGVYYNLGNSYFALGNYKMAEWAYLHSLKLKEDNPNALYNLAKTYEAMGDTKKAAYYMKKSKSIKN